MTSATYTLGKRTRLAATKYGGVILGPRSQYFRLNQPAYLVVKAALAGRPEDAIITLLRSHYRDDPQVFEADVAGDVRTILARCVAERILVKK